MEEQMDIFTDTQKNDDMMEESDDKSKGNLDNEQRSTRDEDSAEYKKTHTYEITRTDFTLHSLGNRLTGQYDWITNDIVPNSASQIIHVDYNLSYDMIQRLYDQERIITYYTEHTYTTWVNKNVKKQKKTKRRKKRS